MGKPPKVIGPQTLVKQRLEFRDGHLVVSQAKGKRRRSNATREAEPSNLNEERRSNVVREDGPSNVNEEGGEHGQEARLFEGLTAPFDDFGSLPEERNDYHIAQKMDEIIVNQRIILAEQESIRREQREMRSCMSGLLRFLKCQHRKSGCSEEELKDLDEPSSSAN